MAMLNDNLGEETAHSLLSLLWELTLYGWLREKRCRVEGFSTQNPPSRGLEPTKQPWIVSSRETRGNWITMTTVRCLPQMSQQWKSWTYKSSKTRHRIITSHNHETIGNQHRRQTWRDSASRVKLGPHLVELRSGTLGNCSVTATLGLWTRTKTVLGQKSRSKLAKQWETAPMTQSGRLIVRLIRSLSSNRCQIMIGNRPLEVKLTVSGANFPSWLKVSSWAPSTKWPWWIWTCTVSNP